MKFPTAGLACLVPNHVTFNDTQINAQHTHSCRNSTTHVRSSHQLVLHHKPYGEPVWISVRDFWLYTFLLTHLCDGIFNFLSIPLCLSASFNDVFLRWHHMYQCTTSYNVTHCLLVVKRTTRRPNPSKINSVLDRSCNFLFNWISSNSSYHTIQHSYRTYCLCQTFRTNYKMFLLFLLFELYEGIAWQHHTAMTSHLAAGSRCLVMKPLTYYNSPPASLSLQYDSDLDHHTGCPYRDLWMDFGEKPQIPWERYVHCLEVQCHHPHSFCYADLYEQGY